MNICCQGLDYDDTRITDAKLDEIILKIDKASLKFSDEEGVFQLLDDDSSVSVGAKKLEIKELKDKLSQKDKEIEDYNEMIQNLNDKIIAMEKMLLMDQKEQLYIQKLARESGF